ncbi:MAG: PD-(D/E)XK nuclease family protein, partial [Bacteroidales bacterium]|nr:PD-(D/E)XK nuclease family protein [Bacteroidales bacterium]
MEHGFLYQIAKQYVGHYEAKIKDLCFVFPSRRSALFFRKYLGQNSEAPIFSPRIMTINEILVELSDLRKIDKIEEIYLLYQNYVKVSGTDESFDSFAAWGDVILADFNDVDKYRVDASRLFANIRDLRELDSGYEFLSEEQRRVISDFWGIVLNQKPDRNKERFCAMWQILEKLYVEFRKDLKGRGMGYEGMIYREVADALLGEGRAAIIGRLSQYEKIVFVGQNALSECEKVLFDAVRDELGGDFYWDFYGDMIRDRANKSSNFIKDYIVRYPSQFKIDVEVDTMPEITVISVPSAVGQAKQVARCLEGLDENKTSVVLPDETLLLPLLNSIPGHIADVNVTMGLSLSNSSFSVLMEFLGALQTGKSLKNGRQSFYHRDVSNILNHPLIKRAAGEDARALNAMIVAQNLIYWNPAAIPFKCKDETAAAVLDVIFKPVEKAAQTAQWQLEVTDALAPYVSPLEKEFAHGFSVAIRRIRDLEIEMSQKTYLRFLRRMTAKLNVPYRGEPLSGLQIMGPLETRVIDFENVIMLSVSEGTFPAKSFANSLIPANLRLGYGLPTVEYLDSIAAYHFYRSIYRAKKVFLLYDSRTAGLRSGEESRFIKQLKYHYNLPVKDQVCTYSVKPSIAEQKIIEKDDEVMAQLRSVFIENRKKFSATSLNCYLDCPLKFYYNYVLGLAKADEVSETIEADSFGKIFHGTMEELYSDYIGKLVKREDLIAMSESTERLDDIITRQAVKVLRLGNAAPSGKLLMELGMIRTLVEMTLDFDFRRAPFVYVASELEMKMPFSVEPEEGEKFTVWLKGFID